jgi:hypothetical protein
MIFIGAKKKSLLAGRNDRHQPADLLEEENTTDSGKLE